MPPAPPDKHANARTALLACEICSGPDGVLGLESGLHCQPCASKRAVDRSAQRAAASQKKRDEGAQLKLCVNCGARVRAVTGDGICPGCSNRGVVWRAQKPDVAAMRARYRRSILAPSVRPAGMAKPVRRFIPMGDVKRG